jgi:hypothetical protein
MRAKRVALSVAAGLATPGAVFLLNSALGGFRFAFIEPWFAAMYVAVGFLLALAVALCRPILPVVYGVTTALICPLIGIVVGAGYNLVGLLVIALLIMGLVIAIPVAALATLLRHRSLPKWSPIAAGTAALLLSFGIQAWSSAKAHDASSSIVTRLQRIRAAELAYAASRPDHAYTCNGPDLPGLPGIAWRANESLGTLEKNEAFLDGHWISLQCQASAHPKFFGITAVPTFGGKRVELGSNGESSFR